MAKQPEQQSDLKKKQFLLTNLVVIFLVIICLMFLIVAYPYFFPPPDKAELVSSINVDGKQVVSPLPESSLIPSKTPTLRPTFTPSITPTATKPDEKDPTPIPMGPPTLTPALPLKDSSIYSLSDWTPENADYLIKMMQGYPFTLIKKNSADVKDAFYQAFQYAVVAEKEALLRFPDSGFGQNWEFNLAYDLARTGDPRAGEQYAEILARNLNNGNVQIGNLKLWFEEREPRLILSVLPDSVPKGFLNSYLVEIRGNGATYIRIIQTSGTYKASALITYFDFVNPVKPYWMIDDLVDELEGDELVVYFSSSVDEFQLAPPHVFGFDGVDVINLKFKPESNLFDVGMTYTNYWRILKESSGESVLVFEVTLFPVCEVRVQRAYKWDGNHFVFIWDKYSVEPEKLTLNYCELAVNHAAEFWGPHAAIEVMEPLLPLWPPEKNLEGNSYPLDAPDEWRYRLGVYHALVGNYEKAVSYFSGVIDEPSTEESHWIEPAEQFIGIYKTPRDVYKACLDAQYCDPNIALEFLIESLSIEEFKNVMQILWDNNVNILSSGYFDFEKDGSKERWIVIRHHLLDPMEFWILAPNKTGGSGILVTNVESIPPTIGYLDVAYLEYIPASTLPVVFVDNNYAFQLGHMDVGMDAYIIPVSLRKVYPDKFAIGLNQAEQTLFSGDFVDANHQFVALEEYPGLLCKNTWSCDRYYYLLGLSYELINREVDALNTYLELWRNYSKSQFTIMARMKIEGGAVLPTITYTPTASSTLIQPSSTATATLNPNITPTLTATPTPTSSTPYPPPNPTATNPPYPISTPSPTTPGYP